ncbi:MAG: alanine racemase, partial [Clostridia bacterium]|nr:alanine racemase [Clostridia bacterium]
MEYLRSYARIDLDAVGKNVAGVRAVIPDGTKIMAIIKANAYGHGAVALARYLDAKVDWYGVATLHEALELRKANVEKDILVLGAMDPAEYPQAVRAGITVAISSYAN